jgi:hypothetical protein
MSHSVKNLYRQHKLSLVLNEFLRAKRKLKLSIFDNKLLSNNRVDTKPRFESRELTPY